MVYLYRPYFDETRTSFLSIDHVEYIIIVVNSDKEIGYRIDQDSAFGLAWWKWKWKVEECEN